MHDLRDDDDLEGVDLPPDLQFTPENVARTLEQGDRDIAAGRLVPVEDVLRRLDARIAEAEGARRVRQAAE